METGGQHTPLGVLLVVFLFDPMNDDELAAEDASEEGKHMARAASQVHQDVFGLLIYFLKGMVIETTERDVLFHLTKYNFGEEVAYTLTPRAPLGNVDRQDFATFSTGIAKLYTAGVIDDTQLPVIHGMLWLPPVPEERMKELETERKQKREQAVIEQKQPDEEAASGNENESELE